MASRKVQDGAGNEIYVNVRGELHRVGQPAGIFKSGTDVIEVWMLDGHRHRENGPAVIIRDVAGLETHEFFLEGRSIREHHFEAEKERIRIRKLHQTPVFKAILGKKK